MSVGDFSSRTFRWTTASPAPVGGPWRNVDAFVRDRTRRFASRPLIRFGGQAMSFQEVASGSARIANALQRRGVRKGDPVAVMLPNGFGFPLIWLGLLRIGAIIVPLNTGYRASDLEYVLRDSGARLAVVDEACTDLVAAVQPRCPALQEVLSYDARAGPSADRFADLAREAALEPSDLRVVDVARDDPANIQYTSGTTGFPKGCVQTHEFHLVLTDATSTILDWRPDDVVLTAQPFYYMDPQWNLLMCMRAGIPLVVEPRFSASAFWDRIVAERVTFFYCLGTMPILLYKQRPRPDVEKAHRLRMVACSGITPALHAAFEERWNVPWREVYGMTEVGAITFVDLDRGDLVGSQSVGVPALHRTVRVVDDEGRGVPDGTIGEIVVQGPGIMKGYWGQDAATAHLFRDGWFHTGDLGVRGPEGDFYLRGRTKDMIRRSNENISAAEVEAALTQHPLVREAACVPVPDEVRGEEVKAFIRLQPGANADDGTAKDLVEFVRGRLAAFKAPRFVEFVDDFPKTPSERISKHVLLASRSDHRSGCHDANPR